jgi:hypothetical protein
LRRSQFKSDLKQAEICRYEFLQLLDFVFQKNGPLSLSETVYLANRRESGDARGR